MENVSTIYTKLKIGASAPFKLVQTTDTHFTFADMRDGERKVKLAEKREKIFRANHKAFEKAVEISTSLGAPIIHTGDLIDFVSEANLEAVKRFTETHDYFICAGNHEFSLFVGEAREDEAYRNKSLALVQSVYPNDIRMVSRIINGVNIVALDNGYYLFDKEQKEFLQKEISKGLPILLMLHVPLYEHSLYEERMAVNPCAYLAGVPEELMTCYPEHRYEQQLANPITTDTIELIKSTDIIKCVIAGHIHVNTEKMLTPTLAQITTSETDVRIIEIE